MKRFISEEIILNSLEQNIFIKDINSVYLFANDAYASLVHQEVNSIIGKSDYDFFPKDIADKYRKDDRFIIENEEVIDIKESILVDNEYRKIKTIKKPLYEDGKVIAVLGIFWDVTESEKEQESLKKLEYGLNKAQELANIGHWELDLLENKLFWSDEVYRIFGLEPQEFGATYEAFLEYIHPDDKDLVNKVYTESVKIKQGYNVTHRIIRKNGEIGFVEERCVHELDKENNVIRSIGTVHDITERKKAENELSLAYNVFAKMHDGIIITDAQQNIISVNEAFTKISGYQADEIIGKRPSVLSSGWHDEQFYKGVWEKVNNRAQWEGEIVDRKKNGETYIAELKILPIFNNDDILTNYIAITSDISRKKEQEKLIHNLAYFDSLTDLPNKILFEERVTSRIPVMKRIDKKMAIMFIDIDNFKNINDTLGHSIGDHFLIEVSKRIKKILREQDTLARLGGDEFTILIENFESIDKVAYIAQKIVQVFKEPLQIEGQTIFSGVSLGISVYPDDGTTYYELIKAADMAMYQVKDFGKRNYKFYTPSMNESIVKRMNIENNLYNAIKNKEFFLEYQPKVDTKNNNVYGMEALIRWEQPQEGLIRPDEFISIAEDTGQIYDIGLWVFEQAVSDLTEFHKAGKKLIVSINISSKQLENIKFSDDICEIVNKFDIEKKYIDLEITESHIMNNIEEALSILDNLHNLGFKISIDDFGTGYSSLS
ncbi:MAG: diguanylate cyclase, partial [Thiovulaceae bacterium]|nr:diguanylate cyclase [Sulfurimonadaceae bacterium]